LEFEKDIVNCLEALKNGKLILYPTDTVWGIGCDATNENAVQKIFALKKRPDEKSMIVLVTDEKELLRYIAQPDPGVFNYLKETEKPTTVIYQGARRLADNLINKDGSIAIRICKDPFCKHLIKRFQKPIVSTSANISGALSPKNFSDISEEIRTNVDYIVQYRQDDKMGAEPSTLIKWEKGKAVILRP